MNDVIISDLPVAKQLTPDFVEAFDEFIPRWLGTIVKPYKEAKEKGVDMLQLMNFVNMGAPAEIYESDGIGYYLHDGSGLRMLGFDADHPNRRYWGWYGCFQQQYPEVVDDCDKRIKNFMYYRPFTSRLYLKDSLYHTVSVHERYLVRARVVDDVAVGSGHRIVYRLVLEVELGQIYRAARSSICPVVRRPQAIVSSPVFVAAHFRVDAFTGGQFKIAIRSGLGREIADARETRSVDCLSCL